MAAHTKPIVGASDTLTISSIATSETTAAEVQYAGGDIAGIKQVTSLAMEYTAGAGADITLRLYGDDGTRNRLVLEFTVTFSATGAISGWQPIYPVVLAGGETLYATAQASAGTGHEVDVWCEFVVATKA